MTPEHETEVADMIVGATGALRIQGGGTRDIGALVEGDVLRTSGLSGVTLYEPGALTLVAQAGTPLQDVAATLAAEGQRLAFEPMDHRALLGTSGNSTIGGVVAANVSGPRRIQVGACRDSLLGVRFVDGAGRVLKNGGRVMKNVTGYDLVKLMAGSWGTLGVMTEVSLKVQAVPETEATLVAEGLTAERAVGALSAALGSPFDVSGAAFVSEDGKAFVRLEGLDSSVRYRATQLQSGACQGWSVVEGDKSAALWRDVRDLTALTGGDSTIWRLSVKPTDAPAVLQKLGNPNAVCDWGGGLIWVDVPDELDLRAAVLEVSGHATMVKASEAMRKHVPVFHPEPAPLAALSRDLRAKFDPRGILNPGLMG
ncbi:glycolate oxidase subunit GlcE [Shimia sp. Alg240-R146]|uniref:glycolate oxidase subunit GlcE n=1 Tax=Shimia sp. Alg240-R146 TaxID=2993449 RepID=UPI0022E17B6C|nr:glycolate oxidase subunit GlcE [Shimia sp. Alg240-R146]